jgi:uncharacterized membrane protein
MKNVAIIVGLLLAAFGIAKLCGANARLAGRIGIAALFAFTAIGHFVKRGEMAAMIPGWIPERVAIVLLSGVLEATLAVLVLFPAYAGAAGIALCIFLVLATPLNIYAAVEHVDFGGHVAGPRYLLFRLPLQLLLIVWTYWFAVRSEEKTA